MSRFALSIIPPTLAVFGCLAASPTLAGAGEAVVQPAPSPAPQPVRSVTYTRDGREYTRYFALEKGPDGLERMVETTGPGGKTASSSQNWTRTEDGAKVSTTSTGPNGKTASSEHEWLMNSMGYTRTGSTTGPDGKTVSSARVVARTDTGSTAQSTIVGPDGQTYTSSAQTSRQDGQATRDKTWTGPNGETVSRVDHWTCNADGTGWTRNSSVTGPKGQQRERSKSIERPPRAKRRAR